MRMIRRKSKKNIISNNMMKNGLLWCNCVNMPRSTFWRVILILTLFLATVICGFVAFMIIYRLEEDIGQSTYSSIAATALEHAQEITNRKLEGAGIMASIFSFAFPDASQWPFVALEGYIETASRVAKQSASTSNAVIMIVKPEDATEFEQFAWQTYRKHEYPESAGNLSDFGFGIWTREILDGQPHRIRSNSGVHSFRTDHNILTPIFQHNIQNAKSLLFDVYSEESRAHAIDGMLQCAKEAKHNVMVHNETIEYPSCSSLTDIVELVVRPGPAALLYTPVYPAHNHTNVVAFMGVSINWEQVLTNIVPDYVDGLDCVISTDTKTITYTIIAGRPHLRGESDLHDRNYDKYAKSVILNENMTNANVSAVYTMTVYPSKAMLDEFHTNSSVEVALGFVGVIIFCTLVFFVYDFFMKHEVHQRRIILEMKRRFVRFTSHEIRNPLNTVCMGLELLKMEQRSAINKDDGTLAVNTEVLEDWINLTSDILENSETAVLVLNDVLNYDKIETGTLHLEVGRVRILQLAEKLVNQFQIQAKNRNISLDFILQQSVASSSANSSKIKQESTVTLQPLFSLDPTVLNGRNTPGYSNIAKTLRRLRVVGDDMRLSQVLRNLLSNAIKFTPKEGKIQVLAYHDPEGLPNAKVLDLPPSRDNLDCTVNEATGQHHDNSSGNYQEAQRAGSIIISVKDSGAGMSPAQLEKVFAEGVQFNANKLQGGGGSGLGLFIARNLVEQHGGVISVASKGHGMGCTFTVELPLMIMMHQSSSLLLSDSKKKNDTDPGYGYLTAPESSSGDEHEPPTTQSHKILVVDDAYLNRKMLVRLLEKAGHSCEVASNGQEAVQVYLENRKNIDLLKNQQQAQEAGVVDDVHNHTDIEAQKATVEQQTTNPASKQIDTILMDFEMPVLNGPGATEKLRDLGCTALIFGVTGNLLTEDVAHFKLKGADEVLPKPFSMAALKDCWSNHHRLA